LIPVVTAADAAYFPGVVALYNSFNQNAGPGFEFYAILYGKEVQERGRALGINVIEPPKWETRFPTTEKWPEPSAPMYARLLVPQLFPHQPLAIWLDADCIIVQPLAGLDMPFDEPLAAVHFNNTNYTLGFHIPNIEAHLRQIPCAFVGLMVFNVPAWRLARITDACVEVMNAETDYDFRFVVQSVLGLVLLGNYKRLPECWQAFANRQKLPDNPRILHWVGALPWVQQMPHQGIWNQYA
jgi:lipopolysaccharide biosynthesis glycosyltransferase